MRSSGRRPSVSSSVWWVVWVLLILITAAFYTNGYFLAAVFAGWCGGIAAVRLYDRYV